MADDKIGEAEPQQATGGRGAFDPDRVQMIDIDTLVLDPANVRTHPQRNLDAIIGSLQAFGQQKPVVVDADNVVRAGNGLVRAARLLGWSQVAAYTTGLGGSEAIAYAIADNRTAELSEWDDDGLAAQVEALLAEGVQVESWGWPEDELADLMADDYPTPDAEPVEAPSGEQLDALREKWKTEPGQVWQLGRHRVACGDCRNAEEVARLLDGQQINVAITSPPYASQRKYIEGSGFEPVHPDKFVEWFASVQENVAQNLADDGSWFVNIKEHCHDGQRVLYVKDLTLAHVRQWGWRFVDEFVWVHAGMPKKVQQRFKNGWEPIFQFTRDRHKFRPERVRVKSDHVPKGDGRKTSDRQGLGGSGLGDYINASGLAFPSNCLSLGFNREALGHGAAFPTTLPAFFIKAFSDPDDLVFDPFGGSGSTLIAAEEEGRACAIMDIAAEYVAVMLERWHKMTGDDPILVEGGRDD